MFSSKELSKMSLRWQFLLLVALALLVSLGISGFMAFWQSRKVVIAMTLEKVMAETEQAANAVEHMMDVTYADTSLVPRFPPIPGIIRTWDSEDGTDPEQPGSTTDIWVARLAVITKALMDAHPERTTSRLLDASGSEIMRVDSAMGAVAKSQLINLAGEEFFVEGKKLRQGEVYVSPLRRIPNGSTQVQIATPFYDSSGAFRGVFAFTLDGKAILDQAAKAVTSGMLDIVTEQGEYVWCESDREREFSQAKYSDFMPIRSKAMQRSTTDGDQFQGTISSVDRPDGVALLATYRKVYYSPNDRSRFWLISPSVPANEALIPVTDLAWRFAAVGFLALLLAGIGSYYASRHLTSSLRGLAKAADTIAAGQLDTELPLGQAASEVRMLHRSLDSMTMNLRKMIDESVAQQSRTDAILDSTADAIITIDERGNILSCNATAKKTFGYRDDELVGKKASMLSEVLYQEGTQYDDRPLEPGEVRAVGDEFEIEARRSNGIVFPAALRVTEMNHQGELLFIATLQNITERKEAERERLSILQAIRNSVNRLATSCEQILATTSQQASGTQEQAAAVTQTVATVAQIAQTAEQAADRANAVAESARQADEVGKAGRKAVDDSAQALRIVKEQVESLAENILSLAERAQAIGEITATVKDIAEQTNVLALNAAVEASRAGEHGKGFAVVAAEVKSLADQSKKATAQVRQILGEIQQATNSAVLSTEQGTKSVTAAERVSAEAGATINQLAETLAKSARAATQISASANQQAAGLSQLNSGIQNIDRVTRQNVGAIKQIEQAAQNLTALSHELAGLTAEERRGETD